MYIFKNLLTNDNKNIQNKARYFADCFDFILSNLGKYDFPSMENHRSIFEKIRFQLVNYNVEYSGKYLLYYAKHSFLDKKDEIMKSYYRSTIPLVQEIRSGAFINNAVRSQLIIRVDAFIKDLQLSLLKNAMEEVHTVLHCPKDLSEHNHPRILDYATGIIISEFRFTGFQIPDINRLFDRILSNEIIVVKGRARVNFPLPSGLLEEKFRKESPYSYLQALESFMHERSLREQFEGITNLYDNTRESNKVLFKVSNLQSKIRVNKTYGSVKLTSSVKSYFRTRSGKKAKEFMGENAVYFEVTVHSTNINSGQLLAADLIKKELPRFEIFFRTTFIVDYSNVLMKLNREIHLRQSLNSKWLPRIDPVRSKIEKKIDKLTSGASNTFRQLEIIYAQAKTAQLPEQKMNHYWRYLEVCRGNEYLKAEDLIKKVAEILANRGITSILFNYYQIAAAILWDNRDGIKRGHINLSSREIINFLDINTVQVQWILKAIEYTNHPFLKYRANRMMKMKISEAREQLISYYSDILLEVYEQRNFIQHAGIFHSMSVDKVLLTLPEMVETLRTSLLSVILKDHYENISEVISESRLPPKWLLNLLNKNQYMCDL